jgi:integrase
MNVAVTLEEKRDDEGNITRPAKIGCSTWTMKHARKIMRLAFQCAVDDKLIPVNPVQDITIPKKQAKERKTLNVRELAELFLALENSRWKHSAWFMLLTALRRGEMLALKECDADEINRRITVDKSDSSTGLGGTKGRKVHYVPLTDAAIKCLKEQRKMLQEEENPILYKDELKKTGLIFPNIKGEMLNPNSYYTVIARAAAKAGLHVSPHCLRHTFVYLNKNKLSITELQSILGHESSTTTYDIYGKMLDESLDKTAKQMDDVFQSVGNDMKKQKENIMARAGKVVQFTDLRRAK